MNEDRARPGGRRSGGFFCSRTPVAEGKASDRDRPRTPSLLAFFKYPVSTASRRDPVRDRRAEPACDRPVRDQLGESRGDPVRRGTTAVITTVRIEASAATVRRPRSGRRNPENAAASRRGTDKTIGAISALSPGTFRRTTMSRTASTATDTTVERAANDQGLRPIRGFRAIAICPLTCRAGGATPGSRSSTHRPASPGPARNGP
jgi:hypothetical protein